MSLLKGTKGDYFAKRYTQDYEIDYPDTFARVAKMNTTRISFVLSYPH